MSILWRSYNQLLARYPISTKSFTVSFLYGLGDFLVQCIERNLSSSSSSTKSPWRYDYYRTGKMCFYGAFVSAPLNHHWFGFLDRIVTVGKELRFLGNTMNYKKLLLDQTFFAPFVITCFFTMMTLLDGKGFSAVIPTLKTEFPSALKMNYYLWPAAQFINFSFVPPQHRVGYVSLVVVIWSCMLSWTTNKNKHTQTVAEE